MGRYCPPDMMQKVEALLATCSRGSSDYLLRKGLDQPVFLMPVNSAKNIGGVHFGVGSIVLPLVNPSGMITGAQLINNRGEKRLLPGSHLKSSFIPITDDASSRPLIITEGFATGLAISQFAEGMIVAALSANNLANVAVALRERYPDAQIIVAADNDVTTCGGNNPGKQQAECAALAVNGWVTLPPTRSKADWDDYHQHAGTDTARSAFSRQLYHPKGMDMKTPLILVENDPGHLTTNLPLRKGSDGYNTPQDYNIKGHLPSNTLASIYGPSGSYKSFLAVSWACHIATGKPWASRRVTQGSVVYIVGEGGIGVPRRIRAWEMEFNGGTPIESLYRIDCPVFPASPESAEQVIKAAQDVTEQTGSPVRLIVLDTLARCFGGSDENAAKDMGAFIQGCDHIKAETGATVLVIHHSGKDLDKGARGSSAFRAALDVEFNVRREGEGGALVLSCTKMKDSEEPTTRAYDLSPLNLYIDNDGEEVNSLVVCDQGREVKDEDAPYDAELAGVQRLTANHIALWQSIRSRTASGDGCTKSLVRDDMRAMGFDVSKKFTRWLDKLETEGLISIDGEDICPDSLGNKPRS